MCEHSGVNRILAPCHIPREHGRQRCIAFALAVVQRRIFLRETPDVEHGTAWRIYTGLQISPNEACVSATAFGLEAGIIIPLVTCTCTPMSAYAFITALIWAYVAVALCPCKPALTLSPSTASLKSSRHGSPADRARAGNRCDHFDIAPGGPTCKLHRYRSDHQDQGHVRTTRNRSQRSASPTPNRSVAPRRDTRRRDRCDDAEGGMRPTARGLARSIGGTLRAVTKLGGSFEWYRPVRCRRRQGNCGRARLIPKLGFVLPRQNSFATGDPPQEIDLRPSAEGDIRRCG